MGNPMDDYYSGATELMNQLKQQSQAPKTGLAGLDPVWLAAAQGFLSPTKTGGFGESVANAADKVQAPLKAIKDQQLSAADKLRTVQEATAKMYMLQQQRAQDQANAEAALAGQAEDRALRAKRYDLLANDDLNNEFQAIKQYLSTFPSDVMLTPEQRQEKAEKLKRQNEILNILKSRSTGVSEEEQPPVPGAKRGWTREGKRAWFIQQGDKWNIVE